MKVKLNDELCGDNFKYRLSLRRKKGNAVFNETRNTFNFLLYGVEHTAKEHSNSEMRKPKLSFRQRVRLSTRALVYTSSHRQHGAYHGLLHTWDTGQRSIG